MKTFLRTSLFRILAVIAFLTVSGFGYNNRRLQPVFNQSYLTQRLPNQVKGVTECPNIVSLCEQENCDCPSCECDTCQNCEGSKCPNYIKATDPAITIETDGITNATTLPAVLPPQPQQPDLASLQIDIADLKEQFNKQFTALYTQLSSEHYQLALICQSSDTQEGSKSPILDPNAQKKAELQSQIEALQSEMAGL